MSDNTSLAHEVGDQVENAFGRSTR